MSRHADRLASWILTGPVGRVVAFVGDLGAASLGWAVKALSQRLSKLRRP